MLQATEAQGATRAWPVEGFRAVAFSGRGTLTIEQGPGASLTGSGPGRRVLDRVEVEVRDGRLRIETRDPGAGELDFLLSIPTLGDLDLAGAVRVRAGPLRTTILGIRLSGATELALERLDAERLRLEASGAADVEASGTVDRFEVGLSGSGSCTAGTLVAREARVRVSGAADLELHATERLDVEASGSADLSYRGRPVVRAAVSGAASLRPLE